MKQLSLTLFFLSVVLFGPSARASHILGGEIRMEATGQRDQYSVSMIVFWDEAQLTIANRDPRLDILIYRKRDNAMMTKATLPLVSSRLISYQNEVCTSLRTLNTREGTYNALVTLNPDEYGDPDGYYIVWERCCRNASISNIRSPGESGLVFYLEFPPLNIRNSSPVFRLPNGDYICKDVPYSINVAATDADGDELRYSIVTPLRGNTSVDEPIGNDMPKALYPQIEWAAGFSANNSIQGNPALNITPQSGELSVTASQLGLFVFTIQCEEFRNGKRIGLVRRDFQSLVIECNPPPPPPVVLDNGQPAKTVAVCDGSPALLETREQGEWSYQWQLNGQNIIGEVNPTISAREPGVYTVKKSPKVQQCTGSATSQPVTVVTKASPTVQIQQSAEAICAGAGGALRLSTKDNASSSYEWQRNSITLNETRSTLVVQEPGKYTLTVRDREGGCAASAVTEIREESVTVELPDETALLRGESLVLKPDIQSSATPLRFAWSPAIDMSDPAVAQPTVSPKQTLTYVLKATSPGGCAAVDSIRVNVIECSLPTPPVIEINGVAAQTAEFCEERPVSLKVQEPGEWAYQWQLEGADIVGATTPNYNAAKVGNYTVTRSFKKNQICSKQVVSPSVKLVKGQPPVATISKSADKLCPNGKLELNAKQDASYAYEWRIGNRALQQTGPTLSIDTEGLYGIKVVNTNTGCVAIDSIRIRLDTTTIPVPGIIHEGKSVQSIEFCAGEEIMLAVNDPGNWSYLWKVDGKVLAGSGNGFLKAESGGNYTVTRSHKSQSSQCVKSVESESVRLSEAPTPAVKITLSSQVLCTGSQLELTASAQGSYLYTWKTTGGSGQIVSENPSMIVTESGNYHLGVEDEKSGCFSQDSVRVEEEKIDVVLTKQIVVRRGESTILNPMVNSSTQDINYLWSPQAGLSDPYTPKPTAFPSQSSNYILEATTPGGCKASDTVYVLIVDRIYIPDAFSPNGDGINDLLEIQNGKELIQSIQIYNRWGTLVFQSAGYISPWDGKVRDSRLPSGTYVYVIHTYFDEYKGKILILD